MLSRIPGLVAVAVFATVVLVWRRSPARDRTVHRAGVVCGGLGFYYFSRALEARPAAAALIAAVSACAAGGVISWVARRSIDGHRASRGLAAARWLVLLAAGTLGGAIAAWRPLALGLVVDIGLGACLVGAWWTLLPPAQTEGPDALRPGGPAQAGGQRR